MKKSESFSELCLFLLFLLFLGLKLSGNIDWSWWWITSPLWIPILFFIVTTLFSILFIVIRKITSKKGSE